MQNIYSISGDMEQIRRSPFGWFYDIGAGLCYGAAALVFLRGAQGLAGVEALAGLPVLFGAGLGAGVAPDEAYARLVWREQGLALGHGSVPGGADHLQRAGDLGCGHQVHTAAGAQGAGGFQAAGPFEEILPLSAGGCCAACLWWLGGKPGAGAAGGGDSRAGADGS